MTGAKSGWGFRLRARVRNGRTVAERTERVGRGKRRRQQTTNSRYHHSKTRRDPSPERFSSRALRTERLTLNARPTTQRTRAKSDERRLRRSLLRFVRRPRDDADVYLRFIFISRLPYYGLYPGNTLCKCRRELLIAVLFIVRPWRTARVTD